MQRGRTLHTKPNKKLTDTIGQPPLHMHRNASVAFPIQHQNTKEKGVKGWLGEEEAHLHGGRNRIRRTVAGVWRWRTLLLGSDCVKEEDNGGSPLLLAPAAG